MLRSLAIGALLASAVTFGCAHAQPFRLDPLAELMQKRLEAADAPACLMLALVEEKVRVAFACTKKAGPVSLARDSIFEIGSIAKGLTGLLLADMVARGEVSLDDPASKHSRPGAKLPTHGGREITLRDLVTHTAGLPRLPPGFAPHDLSDPYARFTADDLYESLARTTIGEGPGNRFEYSNFGFMWLSEMLARRGGKPFDALLRERILEPLGMADTAVTLTPEQASRLVVGHDARYRVVPPWTIATDLAGVGGLRASMDDMIRLAQALLGQGRGPLAATVELALRPLRPTQGRNSVAFGWHVRETPAGRIHWHNGGTGGARSMIAVNATASKAAIVLVDSAQSFDDLAMHLVDPAVAPRKRP